MAINEAGFHITFADGREVSVEFDGDSYCDERFLPKGAELGAISEDVVFFGKGKPNRLRFNAIAVRDNDRVRVEAWSLEPNG